MLLVDHAHERRSGRQDLVDKDEDGLLGSELYPLADDVDKLARCGRGGCETGQGRQEERESKGEGEEGERRRTCPTVRSAGTRYFFLSIAGMSVLSAFSQMTCRVPSRVSAFSRGGGEERAHGDPVGVL